MSSTVHALIEAAARADAIYAVELTADGTPRRTLDYAGLAGSCRRVGALLAAHGLVPGDTVSLVMPNSLQTLRLLLGAMHAGLVVNPVNLLSQPSQMAYVLGHSDCKAVFATPEWEAPVRAAIAGLGRAIEVVVADPALERLPGEPDDTPTNPFPAPAPDAIALLMYTSGTTGVPKGVMLSQSNLAANALAISAEHELTASDRVLAVLPLYHINAYTVTMLAPLVAGGSLAMPPKFSAAHFWQQAADCTWINLVPTMISYLLEGATPAPDRLRALRFCRSASSALPPEHHRAFEARFGIGIIETMGLTETAAPAFSNPLAAELRKLGSVGRASGGEVRVIDAALRPLPDGSTGELAIRGPHVMVGYYKNEPATRATFTPDGWLRTGDLGHRDADGYYFVTGRIKELIIKGGENIAPREIDEVLLAHPAVLDAAAVGMPDAHYGQDILACVVWRPDSARDVENLRAFCRDRLGPYKTPKTIRSVDELPRGPSGKVQRLKLLDALTP